MRRSTILMLVLLAMLAGLYWYMQQPDNVIERAIQPTPTATLVDPEYLIQPEKGPAVRISIERKDGASVRLDKSAGIWLLLTADGSVPAEQETVDYAASAIAGLMVLNKLDPAPEAASIGLDLPAYLISLVMTDGTQINLKVGLKTVTQSGYYVQTDDGNVYIVPVFGIDSLAMLVAVPPYLQTPTPSPLPATETPVPSLTPEPTSTPESTPTP
jgi:hypothetical protein